MNWDSVVEHKQKTIDFVGGASLVEFKAFVASLPDALPENTTASINIKLITNK